MNIELGVLELKYNGKSISLLSDYQTFCDFFDDTDKFYYNGIDVDAAPTSKVIIINALHGVKVPLNQLGFVQILWVGSLSEPSSITIVHDSAMDASKTQYSYHDLLGQIIYSDIVLPVEQASPNKSPHEKGIALNKWTTFSDLCQLFPVLQYDNAKAI